MPLVHRLSMFLVEPLPSKISKLKITIPTWSASPIASSAIQTLPANLHAEDPQRYLGTKLSFDRTNTIQPKWAFWYVFHYFLDARLEWTPLDCHFSSEPVKGLPDCIGPSSFLESEPSYTKAKLNVWQQASWSPSKAVTRVLLGIKSIQIIDCQNDQWVKLKYIITWGPFHEVKLSQRYLQKFSTFNHQQPLISPLAGLFCQSCFARSQRWVGRTRRPLRRSANACYKQHQTLEYIIISIWPFVVALLRLEMNTNWNHVNI